MNPRHVCTACGIAKHSSEFYDSTRTSWCKDCFKKRVRDNRRKRLGVHGPPIPEGIYKCPYCKEYKLGGTHKVGGRTYCVECSARIQENNRIKASGQKRCSKCREIKPLSEFHERRNEVNSYCKGCSAKRKRDPKQTRSARKAWEERNPNHNRTKNHRRRARLNDTESRATTEERQEVWNSYLGLCAYCGNPAEDLDHIAPLVSGGEDSSDNLVPSCKPCNGSKGSKPLIRFLIDRAC